MAWLIFLILCIFFPVAAYCFVLSLINRRGHPTMISGSWDFAGVLFAVSGFLLIGGPLVLAGLNQTFRNFWLQSESASVSALGEYWWYIRLALWALYFGAIAGGSLWLLWKRSRTTSIYNVDPPVFDVALAEVLNRLPLKWARAGNRLLVAFPAFPDHLARERRTQTSEVFDTSEISASADLLGEPGASANLLGEPGASATGVPKQAQTPAGTRAVRGSGTPACPDPAPDPLRVVRGSPDPAPDPTAGLLETEADLRSGESAGSGDPRRAPITSQDSTCVLALDPFPAMRHVTLQWPREAGPWRQEIEAELAHTLLEVRTPDNPAGLWLLAIGSTLFCLIFFALALLVFLSLLRPTG
jgi:hypothetical protein